MAKLILNGGSELWTIPSSSDPITVYGSSTADSIQISAGAKVNFLSFGVDDQLKISGNSSDYSLQGSGATLILTANDGTEIQLPLSTNECDLVFDDISLPAAIRTGDNAGLYVGFQKVSSTIASLSEAAQINSSLTTDGASEAGLNLIPGNVEIEDPYYGSGTLMGTDGDDLLEADASHGFNPYSPYSYLSLYGLAGNDLLYGNAGYNSFFGGEGDDQMNGGGKYDTVYYYSSEEISGALTARVEDKVLIVQDELRDLYRIELDATGSGTVTDLYTDILDSGKDTLNSIETIYISDLYAYPSIPVDLGGGIGSDAAVQTSSSSSSSASMLNSDTAETTAIAEPTLALPDFYMQPAWLEITLDSSGNYKLAGSHYINYYLWDEKVGHGSINGTSLDDIITVSSEQGFQPDNPDSLVDIYAGAGDDSIVGHSGDNRITPDTGNDSIDGGGGTDTLVYYSDYYSIYATTDSAEPQAPAEPTPANEKTGVPEATTTAIQPNDGDINMILPYPPFYYEPTGLDLRQEGELFTLFDNSGDQYLIQFNLDGSGSVEDLDSSNGDNGKDTFSNIERLEFSVGSEYLNLSFDKSGKLQLEGTNYPTYAIKDDGLGNGGIYGTHNDDQLTVSTDQGFLPDNSESRVELYGYAGNDILTGHSGSNFMDGGEGDDTLIGNGGSDTAHYNGYNEDYIQSRLENGSLILFDSQNDLYQLTLSSDGSGSMKDLYSGDGDSGTDSLSGIEWVSIDLYSGYAQRLDINVDSDGVYNFRMSSGQWEMIAY